MDKLQPVAWRKYYIDGFGFSESPVNGGQPLYIHPVDKKCLSYVALEEKTEELLTSGFDDSYIDGFEDGALWCEDEMFNPAQEKYLSLQKTEDGELVAVTYTDDEHRIVEVLWERPPAKTLTDAEIWDFINAFCTDMGDYWELTEKNGIPMIKAILRKANEK